MLLACPGRSECGMRDAGCGKGIGWEPLIAKAFAGLTRRGALRRSCPPAAGAAASLTSLCRTPRLARPGGAWVVRQIHQRWTLITCTLSDSDRQVMNRWIFPLRAPTRMQAANGGWLTQRSKGGGGRRPPGDMSVVDPPPFAATQPLGVQRGANRQASPSPMKARSKKIRCPLRQRFRQPPHRPARPPAA